MRSDATVVVGTSGITLDDVVAVARHDAPVAIGAGAMDEMARTRAMVDALAHSQAPVYGVSTGFGALATRHISAEHRVQLQRSLVRSHAATTGASVER